MTPPYPIVTIAGVGLLGASLGLAMKERGLAQHIRGVGRRQSTLDAAIARGAIDTATLDLAEACDDADLIILCTPAAQVTDQLDSIRSVMKPSAIATDAASTKQAICAHARSTWPTPSHFVGAHPMAGSEKSGPKAARPDLFEGAHCILCPENADEAATHSIQSMWEAVGCTITTMDPATHDRLAARTSHVPHIAAAAIARAVEDSTNAKPMIGSGFRDTTRVAGGRPELWRDICLTNGEAIIDGLNALEAQCAHVRDAIERADAEALTAFFEGGQRARNDLIDP